jgi:hypothetical protein
MGTVNLAQTIASVNLPSGTYDAVRFQITSAEVTFNGANYSAVVQGSQLTIWFETDAVVSGQQASAAIIDIQPTVINVGTISSPRFVMWATAKAFPVPSTDVVTGMGVDGNSVSLSGMKWWDDDRAHASVNLQISGASLSANLLSLNVKDIGASGVKIRMVVVTNANLSGSTGSPDEVPREMLGSAVFLIRPNGTLVEFNRTGGIVSPYVTGVDVNGSSIIDALQLAGYNLTAGSSVGLSYSGAIQLGFGLLAPAQGIASGTSYWITVIGEGAVASTEVTAS